MSSKGLVEGFLFQRLRYNLRQSYVGEGSVANTKPQRTQKTWTAAALPLVLK